ncbi:MAG TPA: homocysteine S-methyltransferase family protein [Pseudolabrys sp.]|nr:homocysteine S-methyltransferase family protein [Pseudolabrys sp.]
MSKYRRQLPQLSGRPFLTDGGLETSLIFHEGIDLPFFASFDLLRTADGTARIQRYYERYIEIAKRNRTGFVLEGATWRANPDWGAKLGYSRDELAAANRAAVELMAKLREVHESAETPMVISANIGPRGDGYKIENAMTAAEAEDYHGWQVDVFRDTEADLVSAFTINYVEEAIGIARACSRAGMLSVISFTVETDGRLPSGQALRAAIEECDRETRNVPAYYMINCAHPAHFADALREGKPWVKRLRGLRANASMRSHAELDAATDLDIGDPADLGARYRGLCRQFGHFSVFGGCCGTDHRHVESIALACLPAEAVREPAC